MTTTVRLSDDLIDALDHIVRVDYRFRSRSHLFECVLRRFVSRHMSGKARLESSYQSNDVDSDT
ncbi:MAG: ribbon-helix-helix protein, CopG family [Myxococcota bacterium]